MFYWGCTAPSHASPAPFPTKNRVFSGFFVLGALGKDLDDPNYLSGTSKF